MDTNRFWKIVGAARAEEGEDDILARVGDALASLSDEDLVGYQLRYDRLHAAAGRDDLWAAGVLLNGGYCSDDGFTDFRAWLISRGRAVYEAALRDPDSLAAQALPADDDGPSASFEAFGYQVQEAWDERGLDEDDLLDALDQAAQDEPEAEDPPQDPDFGDGRCEDAALQRRLPALWARYGRFKQEADQRPPEPLEDPGAVEVPGVGTVRNGATLVHRKYGPGTLSDLMPIPGGPAMANVQFEDGLRPMVIDGTSGLWRLP
jgi:hypothetical protein